MRSAQATLVAAIAAVSVVVPAAAQAARPDLTVTAVRVTPSAVHAGDVVKVTATVRNRGAARARASRFSVALTASRHARAARLIRTSHIRAIRRSHKRSVTTKITVPSSTGPGRWFVRACADVRHRLREQSERNNCRAAAITVVQLGAPLPGNGQPGGGGTPGSGNPNPGSPPAGDIQPSFPVRAAFYYAWFSGTWKQQGITPYTHYHPTLGFYDSSSPSLIKQHLQAFSYAHIDVGISSWWGKGTPTDARVSDLLSATRAVGSPVRWSLYYEAEAQGDPSVDAIASDLAYIRDHYGNDPAFYRINGRFVVFVYADGADACGMVDRWNQANATVRAYVVLKIFPGYKTCANQPDAWHQYSPAKAADSQTGISYAISPGFWKATDTTPVLARDLARYQQNVRDMVASHAPFQLVTTFNEWGEGTAVESANEWASPSGYGDYLDALHNNGG